MRKTFLKTLKLFSICVIVFSVIYGFEYQFESVAGKNIITYAQGVDPNTGNVDPLPASGVGTKPSSGAEQTKRNGWTLSGLIIAITGFFLWIGGMALDAAIHNFILQMGYYVKSTSLGANINTIWTVVRDLVNLSFIFGLVYVGFMTILNGMADTKKLLASVIIGALLVNFSLFISKVVIDVSNITSVQIYQAMGIGSSISSSDKLGEYSVATRFMTYMGIYELVAVPGQQATLVESSVGKDPNDPYIAFVVGASIFVIVAAFVFAAAAVLITIRFGVLIILMILSPVAFAASVFPVFAGWSKTWWNKLLSQAFFAPALLFMLYLTMLIGSGFYTDKKTRGFDQIYTNKGEGLTGTGFDTLVFFSLLIVLMIASLVVAKMMGAYGAERVIGAGQWMRKQTQGYLASRTLGWAAGRYARRLEERGVPSTSARSRIASSLAGSKFGASAGTSYNERYKARKAADQVGARREQVQGISRAISSGWQSTNANRQIAMERAISGASSDQLIGMLEDAKPGSPEYQAIIRHMSSSQFDAVMGAKPEQLNDAAKDSIAAERRRSVQSVLQENAQSAHRASTPAGSPPLPPLSDTVALQKSLGKASTGQLEALGAGVLMQHADHLSSSQMDDLKKSKKLTETEFGRLKDQRDKLLIARYDAGGTTRDELFNGRKDKEIAKLPKKILLHNEVVKHMSAEVLRRIQDEDELTATERRSILNNMFPGGRTAPPHPEANPTGADYLQNNARGKAFA